MATRIVFAALVAALIVAPGAALAQTKSADCPQPSASPGTQPNPRAPERIEGQVTSIDRSSGMVTMRLQDGSTQQFRAGKETLDDLKVGDRIEAKKRASNC
ncbi:MAG TPA: hypothetical protein VNN07_15435 [Candidatus Tectomicrobia bacterium]|nr:hypothetical protein [Candidatus Tectomicrobia bacterium]